jgi:hypothetical protein
MASGPARPRPRMHVRRAKNGTPSVHPIRAMRFVPYASSAVRARPARRTDEHHRLSLSHPEARQGRPKTVLPEGYSPILTRTCQSRPRSSTSSAGCIILALTQTSMRAMRPHAQRLFLRHRAFVAEVGQKPDGLRNLFPSRARFVRRASRAAPASACHICCASSFGRQL